MKKAYLLRLRALAFPLFLAGLTACSKSPTDLLPEGPGRVSLQYEGLISGTFTAEGDVKGKDVGLRYTYAYGRRYRDPGILEISGVQYHGSSNTADGVQVQIPTTKPGSFSIDQDRCPWWQDECPGLSFFLQLLAENGQQARYSCILSTGSIRVIAVTDGRAQGTFAGNGECTDRDDVEGVSHALHITGGEFDVKLLSVTRG